jgi:hypothetical protein
MSRPLVALCLCIAFGALAAPAHAADPCTDDHTGAASFTIRGRVAVPVTLTDQDLRDAVTAGTLTQVTESVSYLTGTTPTNRSYNGVSLYQLMTKEHHDQEHRAALLRHGHRRGRLRVDRRVGRRRPELR